MEKIYKKIGIILLLLTVSFSCDLDGDLVNPNEVSIAGADVDLIMNGIQLDFADFYSFASGNSVNADETAFGPDRLMRMRSMSTGYRYQTAGQSQFFDNVWEWAYSKVLINIETMLPLAAEKNLTTHVAVAKILKAYTYITLVDLFGDVPFASALSGGTGDFNPVADGGESIYTAAIATLEEAKAELAKTGNDAGSALGRDVYYGGDRVKWNALANTIELKAWLNLSMISSRAAEANAAIASLLTANLVDTEEENFVYKYGTATVPVSRHPTYRQYYGPSKGSATGYICNSFLNELFKGKPDANDPTNATKFTEDPRWRFYFFRQVGSIAKANSIDPKAVGCTEGAIPNHYAAGNYEFCTFDPGFYGRDHGDASGTPPDGPVITCAGSYPAGGLSDVTAVAAEQFARQTVQGDGGDGAGIEPIFMSFFTDYMKAEYLVRTGDEAGAKTALVSAINKSITQVKNFSESIKQPVAAALLPSTAKYLAAIDYLWANSTNKIEVVGREFYVACWGNGIEAYNSYRRTGAPTNMQPTLQLNPGPFYRSLVYPAIYVNLNSSATQKDFDATNKVFWDTNPAILN
jgi:hypothetical protein